MGSKIKELFIFLVIVFTSVESNHIELIVHVDENLQGNPTSVTFNRSNFEKFSTCLCNQSTLSCTVGVSPNKAANEILQGVKNEDHKNISEFFVCLSKPGVYVNSLNDIRCNRSTVNTSCLDPHVLRIFQFNSINSISCASNCPQIIFCWYDKNDLLIISNDEGDTNDKCLIPTETSSLATTVVTSTNGKGTLDPTLTESISSTFSSLVTTTSTNKTDTGKEHLTTQIGTTPLDMTASTSIKPVTHKEFSSQTETTSLDITTSTSTNPATHKELSSQTENTSLAITTRVTNEGITGKQSMTKTGPQSAGPSLAVSTTTSNKNSKEEEDQFNTTTSPPGTSNSFKKISLIVGISSSILIIIILTVIIFLVVKRVRRKKRKSDGDETLLDNSAILESANGLCMSQQNNPNKSYQLAGPIALSSSASTYGKDLFNHSSLRSQSFNPSNYEEKSDLAKSSTIDMTDPSVDITEDDFGYSTLPVSNPNVHYARANKAVIDKERQTDLKGTRDSGYTTVNFSENGTPKVSPVNQIVDDSKGEIEHQPDESYIYATVNKTGQRKPEAKSGIYSKLGETVRDIIDPYNELAKPVNEQQEESQTKENSTIQVTVDNIDASYTGSDNLSTQEEMNIKTENLLEEDEDSLPMHQDMSFKVDENNDVHEDEQGTG